MGIRTNPPAPILKESLIRKKLSQLSLDVDDGTAGGGVPTEFSYLSPVYVSSEHARSTRHNKFIHLASTFSFSSHAAAAEGLL